MQSPPPWQAREPDGAGAGDGLPALGGFSPGGGAAPQSSPSSGRRMGPGEASHRGHHGLAHVHGGAHSHGASPSFATPHKRAPAPARAEANYPEQAFPLTKLSIGRAPAPPDALPACIPTFFALCIHFFFITLFQYIFKITPCRPHACEKFTSCASRPPAAPPARPQGLGRAQGLQALPAAAGGPLRAAG